MKNSHRLLSLSRPRRRAVALIIVLSMLVLMSALLVAFMSSVSTERSSAAAATSGFQARQANDTAVNLAISQIRQATSQPTGTSWASQPGAIWAFSTRGKEKVFKLYSSDVMQQNISDYKPEDQEENGIDLGNKHGIVADKGFVDINSPIFVPTAPSGDSANATAKYDVHYPIADPRAGLSIKGEQVEPGHGIVDGFYASKIENPEGKVDIDGKHKIRLLPMPVKWLYQLKDGTIEAADKSGVIQHASKDNPPISRMAFWTDDESAKVNINTASEGTFWDTPMSSNFQESGIVDKPSNNFTLLDKIGGAWGSGSKEKLTKTLNLSAAQPASGEYQRFTGHPATTCLSPVLRWLFDGYEGTNFKTDEKRADDGDLEFKEAIYQLSPRYVGGKSTSLGASVNIAENRDGNGNFIDLRVRKRDRLFANLDEYFFRPDRTPLNKPGDTKAFVKTSAKTAATQVGDRIEKFTPDALEKLRFFLTANSRASELNLFGKPRMCIWPVSDVDNDDPKVSERTAFDDLIVFCSTFPSAAKKMAYYFQRNKINGPDSPNFEISPGSRNRALYEYISDLTSSTIPGTDRSFFAKYGQDKDQILTEMFDYIRCTNLVDTGGKSDPDTGEAFKKNPYTPFCWSGADNASLLNPGAGQVIPMDIPRSDGSNTHGFGRFPTISEVNMLFYYDDKNTPTETYVPAAGVIPVRCVLLIEMTTPSMGYPALAETFQMEINETNPFTCSNAEGGAVLLGIAKTGDVNYVNCDAYLGRNGRFFMGMRGFSNQLLRAVAWGDGTAKTFSKIAGQDAYPFYSKRFYIRDGTQLAITKGSYSIEVKTNSGKLVQHFDINFDPMSLPLPKRLPPPSKVFADRLSSGSKGSDGGWIDGNDVSQSVEANGPSRGDTRMIAALKFVKPDYFVAVPRNGGNHAHTLHAGHGDPYTGYIKEGYLAKNASYLTGKRPDTPSSNTITAGVGDYDRGFSKWPDGAYINKPDEGNIRFDPANVGDDLRLPYFRGEGGYKEVDTEFFSPNRLVSSPVCFGSLPSGVFAGRPWETLKFHPLTGGLDRPNQEPRDHYLLDFFQMPVVEPYAISEPMSTAGRINLNCRIAPFGYLPDKTDSRGYNHYYLERSTGLHALLKSLYVTAIPNGASNGGHNVTDGAGGGVTNNKDQFRHKIDRYRTIDHGIEEFLNKNKFKFFRSATQICDLDLFPLFRKNEEDAQAAEEVDLSVDSVRTDFWENQYTMTGDNMRERPYTYIYPRLTTKSNVYTVHVWSQAISKNTSGDAEHWKKFDEDRDRIVGEYRGSTTIERFLDPADKALEKYDATDAHSESLDSYYRFRILNSKQFSVH